MWMVEARIAHERVLGRCVMNAIWSIREEHDTPPSDSRCDSSHPSKDAIMRIAILFVVSPSDVIRCALLNIPENWLSCFEERNGTLTYAQ